MTVTNIAAQLYQRHTGLLHCANCAKEFNLEPLLYCPFCKRALEYAPFRNKTNQSKLSGCLRDKHRSFSPSGHFRFAQLLPLPVGGTIISLGEGDTPLHRFRRLGEKHHFSRLYLKDEGMNPTGSWKDRAISLVVSSAKSFGYRTVSVYSCGNAGASTAAYAAQAGLKSVIFVLPSVGRAKYNRMRSYGACVVPLRISRADLWRSSRVGELLEEAKSRLGWFPATTVRNPYVGSPYYTEGFKTIAYEIFMDLGETVPDWVFVPAGSGEGLYGIWSGFRNLQALGLAGKIPRIVAAQAETAAPLVRSFRKSSEEVEFLEGSGTIASGLEVMISSNQALRAVYESHGSGEAVDDSAIRRTMSEISDEEGVSASPEGAIGVAAAKKMRSKGRLKADDLIVCISSASGLNYSGTDYIKEFPESGVSTNLSEISDYVKHVIESNKSVERTGPKTK